MKYDRRSAIDLNSSVDVQIRGKTFETDVILASRMRLSRMAAVTHKCAYASLPQNSSNLRTWREQTKSRNGEQREERTIWRV